MINIFRHLRPVSFDYIDPMKTNNNKKHFGFIAQEVNEVVPEVVSYTEDLDEYAVAYGNFAGLFIEAFKEQNEIVKKQIVVN